METKNNRISALQYAIIGTLMGNSLFVGLGTMIIINISRQDSWITALLSLLIGIIPILLILYIINYHPTLNIFAKNKKIFGSVLGNIINLLITVLVFSVLIINIWSVTNYAATKYLSETPLLFVSIIFMIPVIYACYKGIETIGRTSEILALFYIILSIIIIISLFNYSEFNNIKPILANGINPIIDGSIKYISYIILPFLMLLVIPKKDIVDSKKSNKYLFIGYIIGFLFMALVYYMNVSTLGVDIVSLYRYPEYYILKKIEIFGVIENIENFFAIHWLFNMFIFNSMSVYFIKEYIVNMFNITKDNTKLIVISITSIISIIGSLYIFTDSTVAVHFMKTSYPLLIALPLLIIIILSALIISQKKKA